jgi:hypothetical protein
MASYDEVRSCDGGLVEHAKLLDRLEFDRADDLLDRVRTESQRLTTVPPALAARIKCAEAAAVFSRAASIMTDVISIDGVAGENALALAQEACLIAAAAVDAATAPLAKLELLLIQLSSMLVAMQAATAIDAAHGSAIAVPLFTHAMRLCREYTSGYIAAQLDPAEWDDPWTPFIKLLFYRAIETQEPSPVPDPEFISAVSEAKRAAESTHSIPQLLDLYIMHCFVLQRSLITRYSRALADEVHAITREGLALIEQSPERNAPTYQRAKNELEEFLETPEQ